MKKWYALWVLLFSPLVLAQEPPLIDLASEIQPTSEQSIELEAMNSTGEAEASEAQENANNQIKENGQQPALDQKPAEWGYSNALAPRYWADLDPRYALCGQGQSQSPINLNEKQAVNTQGLPSLDIAYREVPLRLKRTAHDLIGEYPLGSYIKLGKARYEFTHYQFKTPSEHHIGGFAYPMEIQLFHRNGEGQQAVISVIVQEGEGNETLQTILNSVPKEPDVLQVFEKLNFNPARFLPAQKQFYRYLGSLTQPPCEQGVIWLVFKNPVQASIGQLIKMNQVVGDNVRPVQPLNGRIPMKSWMSERSDAPAVGKGYYFDY